MTRLSPRRAAISTIFIFVMTLALLGMMAIVFYVSQLRGARERLQRCSDAAALAGAVGTVDDRMLAGRLLMPSCSTPGSTGLEAIHNSIVGGVPATNPDAVLPLSRFAAMVVAYRNLIDEKGLDLNPNDGTKAPFAPLANYADGDIVYGFMNNPFIRTYNTAYIGDPCPSPATDCTYVPVYNINVVRVEGYRTTTYRDAAQTPTLTGPVHVAGLPLVQLNYFDLYDFSTAMLDQDVYGFQPLFTNTTIPVIPIAIRSLITPTNTPFALTNPATTAQTWEDQIGPPYENDNLTYVPSSNSFVAGADNLPEITLILSTSSAYGNATPISIGTTTINGSAPSIVSQVTNGIGNPELTGFGGSLQLAGLSAPYPNTLPVGIINGPDTSDSSDFNALSTALQNLVGQQHIWPLYSGYNSGMSQVLIVGFVAARLIDVQVSGTSMQIRLQATYIHAPTALTNVEQRVNTLPAGWPANKKTALVDTPTQYYTPGIMGPPGSLSYDIPPLNNVPVHNLYISKARLVD